VPELSSGFVRLANDSPVIEDSKAISPFGTTEAMPIITVRTTERSIDAPRQLIYDLTPGLDVDLPVALGQLATSFGRHSAIETRLNLIGTAYQLHPSQHSVLLRLAQEALLNVQQHARARLVQLTLQYETRSVILTIQDDGVGLLDGTHERPGLHALRAMRYRLVELDGQLEVCEGDNGGVVVRASLPRDE
jgi:signal transduction histidine kinase